MSEFTSANLSFVQSTLQYITFSATSKIGASLVMYPAQVIRARLQQYNADNEYLSMRNVISRTAKEEGILGFYKGYIEYLEDVRKSIY